jgi:hypothetical protein
MTVRPSYWSRATIRRQPVQRHVNMTEGSTAVALNVAVAVLLTTLPS